MRDRLELDARDALDPIAQLRWQSAIPPPDLFREPLPVTGDRIVPLRVKPTDPAFVDRAVCERVMRDDSMPPDVSWACAHMVDAMRFVSREGLDAAMCPVALLRHDAVVTHLTLPPMHADIHGVSFFTELASLTHIMRYLFSKTLNERCQARMWDHIVLQCFEHDRPTSYQLRRLVLCSLLGNFTTSRASTRPRAEVRQRLYQVLMDDADAYTEWFKALLKQDKGLLVLFCVREFLVFGIRDDPGLCEAVKDMMHLDDFEAITAHAMNGVRDYFDSRMFEPCSQLSLSIARDDDPRVVAAGEDGPLALKWWRDLSRHLGDCKSAILRISYRRPKRPLLQYFLTVNRGLPPVPNPHLVRRYDEEEAPEQDVRHLTDSIGFLALSTAATAQLPDESLELVKQFARSSSLDSTAPPTHFISREQLRAISEILDRVLPFAGAKSDVVREFLPWLVHLGVPQEVVAYVSIMNEPTSQTDVISDEELRRRVVFLREQQPHAYNILQAVATIAARHRRVSTLSILPTHYWRNQINAIKTRFGQNRKEEDLGSGFMANMIYLVYCNECGTIYSLLRDPQSPHKQSYAYGYRDVVVDYDEDEIYCSRDRSPGSSCGKEPLSRALLLGQVIRYGNQTILLCPQKGCGMPMVHDPAYCGFSARGVACIECTRALRLERQVERDLALLEQYVAPIQTFVTCDICGADIWKPQQMFWYPHNLHLCRKHANASMRHFLNRTPEGRDLLARQPESQELLLTLMQLDAARERSQRAPLRKGAGRRVPPIDA